MIGTSPGKIGTAVGQQHLRSIMESTRECLRDYMAEFHRYITRVYTAVSRGRAEPGG